MRRQITLLVAAITSILLLAFLLPTAYLVSRVAHNNALSRAQLQVQALIPILALSPVEATDVAVQGVRGAGYLVWITVPGGTTVGTDPAGGSLDGVGLTSAETRDTDGLDGAPGGVVIAQPVSRSDGIAVIRLLITDDQLQSGVTRIWLILGGIGLALFVLSLVVADRLARSMTRPIRELSTTAKSLGAGQLSARVAPAGPTEVEAAGVALNQLGGRISELLAAERESVADLSHRLRTPVTALRLDADSLHDPDERARLTQDIDELNRAVDEIIRTARRTADDAPARCDAAAVVRERLVFWKVLAAHQDRAVNEEIDAGPLPAALAASELAAALDALLGNVFSHTPDGTGFEVGCFARGGGGATVDVIDSGPGILDDAVLRGESGGTSTGLGLDIARQAATNSGGSLHIGRTDDGRPQVTLELGPVVELSRP